MVKCSKCGCKLDENFAIEYEWKQVVKDGVGEFDVDIEPERVVLCTKCGHTVSEDKVKKAGVWEVFFGE
jgi:predicted nucleic-acid-binding Zn-ribbon protein